MKDIQTFEHFNQEHSGVKIWRQSETIPTYKPHPPERNPIFFEGRNNQGTRGKVYPIPFTDRLSDEPTDEVYDAGFIENEFIKIMVLPELGGRIHVGMDKTNGYHFIYHNRVIKPAMIGLCGPWLAGGIEINACLTANK